MACLKKSDYLLVFGEVFLAVGLAITLYTRRTSSDIFRLPPAIISTLIIYSLTLLASFRKLKETRLTISLVAPFFLSTPLLIVSANLIQAYAKEGKYISPFVSELLDKMGNNFFTISLLVSLVFSVATYLLIKTLVLPGIKALSLEGGNILVENYTRPPEHRLAYLAVPIGVFFSYIHGIPLSTITILPFLMLAPLPLQTSTVIGLFLSILGVTLNPLALALSLILYSMVWRRLWNIGAYRPPSLIIGAGVYLLVSLLTFFTLFGAQFVIYLVATTLLMLLVAYVILGLEAKGVIFSPYALLLVSQMFTEGATPVRLEPLFPLILSATPFILSALYIEKSLGHIDEECGTITFESLLLFLPLIFMFLLYNTPEKPPSPRIPTEYPSLSYIIPMLALIFSIFQQSSMKGKIPGRIEPLLLLPTHPLGLAVSLLVRTEEALPLLLLATLLTLSRIILSKHVQVYNEFSRLFLLGYSIGFLSRILLQS